jgi:hypothetical protein
LYLFLHIFSLVHQSNSTMKTFSLYSFISIFCLLVLFSCKKNDPLGCSGAWATELQSEITEISQALADYYSDQTDANCNALKAAYRDYIDALKPYGNCATLTGQSRTDWQSAINDAEASIDTLC